MDPRGRIITIHPLTDEGAVVPQGYDTRPSIKAYQDQLAKMLTKAGLIVRGPGGAPSDEELIVTGRLVRMSPGSALQRFLLGWLSALTGGGAVFEVESGIGDATTPYAQLHATGRNPFGMPWGSNQRGVKTAAMMAANSVAKQSAATLKAR